MRISTITQSDKQILKAYAARAYDDARPRKTNFVEVNIPEFLPTVPMDDEKEEVALNSSLVVNQNYPVNEPKAVLSHCIELPLVRGTTCPIYFPKGQEFLLLNIADSIEDALLIFI